MPLRRQTTSRKRKSFAEGFVLISLTFFSGVISILRHRVIDVNTTYGNAPSLIDTSGIETTFQILGNPNTCVDVIYTCDGRIPTSTAENRSIVDASWDIMVKISYIPKFNQTCFVFFQLSDQYFTTNEREGIHMVWGRLPATAMVLSIFREAQYMLYLDTDAVFSSSKYTPTDMYHQLSSVGYKEPNSTVQYLSPALIVNKPMTGWLCHQCMYFALEHGCFNTGALLWKRSYGMNLVIQRWWASRLLKGTQNLFLNNNTTKRPFFGWDAKTTAANKMSEQNRLIYLFQVDPDLKKQVWPVPRAPSHKTKTSSCPEDVRFHSPCLQNDRSGSRAAEWNEDEPSCFINHYADKKYKMHDVLDKLLRFRVNA